MSCRACDYYLPASTGCLMEGGNRRLEIEKLKKGLTGDCDDYKERVQE